MFDRRKKPPWERKCWEPKELWERHREILGRVLLGEKNVNIAAELSIHPQTVSLVRNSTLGKARVQEMREERDEGFIAAKKGIEALVPKALAVYEELMGEDRSDNVRLRAAQGVLNHQAVNPKASEAEVHNHLHLHQETVTEIKERGKQFAREMGLIAVPGGRK